jgi:hypothetical protein
MASPAVTATTTIRPNEPAITALVTALVSCPLGSARLVPPGWAALVAGTGLVWPGLVWPGLGWPGLGWPGLGWPGLGWPGLAAGAAAGSPGRTAVTARTGSTRP